ncbi:ATP-dependent DNA helicase [Thioalkalivibrio thiocyanodenitrificans]|uniref:ATP-dependent DNA helicase n=1 Tax=Thioalkalivibrio thiocyanodenitrificans TaxID=243063 RepID=UPI00037C5A59|nr:helicase C-terminal domain-containing protein [Thioalkalivibrio thiocyanodenitrificans]
MTPEHSQFHPDIVEAYRRLGESAGFGWRDEQVRLSQEIMEALLKGRVLCAEAPTGTGKSLAYLIAAIAVQGIREREGKDVMPIVVATNTVALQAQLFDKDIPVLTRMGFLGSDDMVLAKGRGRYMCLHEAQRIAGHPLRPIQRQEDLFGFGSEELDPRMPAEKRGAERLLGVWRAGAWQGDVDAWDGEPPAIWEAVRSSPETCIGEKCWAYEKACPFYSARRSLAGARIIIANHDMVLVDLKARRNGAEPVFPVSDYMLVIDEAHHLPSKAVEHAKTRIAVRDGLYLARQIAELAEKCAPLTPLSVLVDVTGWYQVLTSRKFTRVIRDLGGWLSNVFPDAGAGPYHRFAECPEDLAVLISEVTRPGWFISLTLKKVAHALGHVAATEPELARKLEVESLSLSAKLEHYLSGLKQFADQDTSVRWVGVETHDRKTQYTICTGPLEGAQVLEPDLFAVISRTVLVSATLRVEGDFSFFARRAGLPSSTRYLALPHIFPYEKSVLHIPRLGMRPPRDPQGYARYTALLAAWLSANIDPREATLVLFTSRQIMEMTRARMAHPLRAQVIAQKPRGHQSQVREHRARIDSGDGSVLFGVATLSEGVDLPGAYCRHVIITRIPFEHPNDPIREAVREHYGSEHFEANIMPEATRKLIQAAGRLIRRETDVGRLTLLDDRLLEIERVGRMLDSLPPFHRIADAAALSA